VRDDELPGPITDPDLPAFGRKTTPVLVYFFVAGWTLGTIDTSDGVCRA